MNTLAIRESEIISHREIKIRFFQKRITRRTLFKNYRLQRQTNWKFPFHLLLLTHSPYPNKHLQQTSSTLKPVSHLPLWFRINYPQDRKLCIAVRKPWLIDRVSLKTFEENYLKFSKFERRRQKKNRMEGRFKDRKFLWQTNLGLTCEEIFCQ